MPLIEYYDLKKGVLDPPSGLDARSRAILTEIFDYVLTGWARVLDRIAALAIVEIPICPLTFTTVMAAIDVPTAWVVGKISDAGERRAVKAIFEEYQATGQVVKNLPPEIRAVASLKPLPPEKCPTPIKKILHPAPIQQIQPLQESITQASVTKAPVLQTPRPQTPPPQSPVPLTPSEKVAVPEPVENVAVEALTGANHQNV
jgi:hypothetical protein